MPIRALRAEELAEVEKVFSTGLDVTRVRVNEDASLPDWIGTHRRETARHSPPEHNAITLGNTCYFPVTLTTNDPANPLWLRDMGWLMHELTHAWQYQHDGIVYLYQAVFKSPTYQYTPAGRISRRRAERLQQSGQGLSRFQPRAAG